MFLRSLHSPLPLHRFHRELCEKESKGMMQYKTDMFLLLYFVNHITYHYYVLDNLSRPRPMPYILSSFSKEGVHYAT